MRRHSSSLRAPLGGCRRAMLVLTGRRWPPVVGAGRKQLDQCVARRMDGVVVSIPNPYFFGPNSHF